MSETAIRAAIKSEIEAALPNAIVHDYERWAKNWSDVITLLKTSGNIVHSWMISRRQVVRQQATHCEIEVCHIYTIRGVYGLNDSNGSEKTFQGHIDSLTEAFDDDQTMGGVCDTIHPDFGPLTGAVGLQVNDISHRMFGTILCHYAECSLGAIELVYEEN
jgi:hypothetical protein